jgi:hypothetical protein
MMAMVADIAVASRATSHNDHMGYANLDTSQQYN